MFFIGTHKKYNGNIPLTDGDTPTPNRVLPPSRVLLVAQKAMQTKNPHHLLGNKPDRCELSWTGGSTVCSRTPGVTLEDEPHDTPSGQLAPE
jgi:hypothetical protein